LSSTEVKSSARLSIEVIVDRFDLEEGVQLLRLKGTAIDANWDNSEGSCRRGRVTKTIKGLWKSTSTAFRGFLPDQSMTSRESTTPRSTSSAIKAIVTEPISRERNSSSPAASCWSQSGPSSASAPGPPREGQVHEGVSARSKASASSSTSVASMAAADRRD